MIVLCLEFNSIFSRIGCPSYVVPLIAEQGPDARRSILVPYLTKKHIYISTFFLPEFSAKKKLCLKLSYVPRPPSWCRARFVCMLYCLDKENTTTCLAHETAVGGKRMRCTRMELRSTGLQRHHSCHEQNNIKI